MISKEELRKEYFKIYSSHEQVHKKDCYNCPVHNALEPGGIFSSVFSGCGRKEYGLLKSFVPNLTQQRFIEINNGKSVFCNFPGNKRNSYEVAYELYLLLCNNRKTVKI